MDGAFINPCAQNAKCFDSSQKSFCTCFHCKITSFLHLFCGHNMGAIPLTLTQHPLVEASFSRNYFLLFSCNGKQQVPWKKDYPFPNWDWSGWCVHRFCCHIFLNNWSCSKPRFFGGFFDSLAAACLALQWCYWWEIAITPMANTLGAAIEGSRLKSNFLSRITMVKETHNIHARSTILILGSSQMVPQYTRTYN